MAGTEDQIHLSEVQMRERRLHIARRRPPHLLSLQVPCDCCSFTSHPALPAPSSWPQSPEENAGVPIVLSESIGVCFFPGCLSGEDRMKRGGYAPGQSSFVWYKTEQRAAAWSQDLGPAVQIWHLKWLFQDFPRGRKSPKYCSRSISNSSPVPGFSWELRVVSTLTPSSWVQKIGDPFPASCTAQIPAMLLKLPNNTLCWFSCYRWCKHGWINLNK